MANPSQMRVREPVYYGPGSERKWDNGWWRDMIRGRRERSVTEKRGGIGAYFVCKLHDH